MRINNRPQTSLHAALGVVLVAGSLINSHARADECLAPAPGSLLTDDSYYELNTSSISGGEQQLEDFARTLSGRWWGTQLEVICSSDSDSDSDSDSTAVVPRSSQYRIAAEFSEHFNGALRLEAERENSEAVKLTTIWLSPEYRKDRKGTELGWRTYDVSFPDSNTLVFDEKYRVTNRQLVSGNFPADSFVRGFVRLIQDIKTVSLQQDATLTIERKLYVNGQLVAEEGWILERDYFGLISD